MIAERILESLFFAKHHLWRRRALHYYRDLRRNQHLSADELEALNWHKRKRLLDHAYSHVPFYHLRFKRIGLHPGDIQRPDQYADVPLLTKDDLRGHFDELVADNVRRRHLKLSTTGGSTGEPVKVFLDRRAPAAALGWRMMSWWGISPSADAAVVWRQPPQSALGRLLEQLYWWPAARIKLDASSMSPTELERFLARFDRLRPALLHGYVGAIDQLAAFAEHSGREVWSPKAIWATSSPISAVQRQRLERVFRAPVFDQYGCCECYWIAAQCRERGALHVFADARHVEFTDDTGRPRPAGQMGSIVITDLENYAFPLIRYANGDQGRALDGQCPCGMRLPLMDEVKGRQTDHVLLPDGTCISGDYLTTLFDEFPTVVNAFQVRQRPDRSLQILYVPNGNPEALAQALDKIRADLTAKTHAQVGIAMKAVERIAHDRGKLRFVVSEVA